MNSTHQENQYSNNYDDIKMLLDDEQFKPFEEEDFANDVTMEIFDSDPGDLVNLFDLEYPPVPPLSGNFQPSERKNSLLLTRRTSVNSRRHSLLSWTTNDFEVPLECKSENEFQECFEHFSSDTAQVSSNVHGYTNQVSVPTNLPDYSSRPMQVPSNADAVPDVCQSTPSSPGSTGVIEMDTSSDEFTQHFKRSLSSLEQSMRRSEQSRLMLGEQKPALRNALLSYMSQLGNSTMQ
jgi:hypothetical protein